MPGRQQGGVGTVAARRGHALVKRTLSPTLYSCMFPDLLIFQKKPRSGYLCKKAWHLIPRASSPCSGQPGRSRGGGSLEPSRPAGNSSAKKRVWGQWVPVAEGWKSPRQTPQAHLQVLLPAARPFKDSETFSPAAPVTVAVSIAVPSICRASVEQRAFPGQVPHPV